MNSAFVFSNGGGASCADDTIALALGARNSRLWSTVGLLSSACARRDVNFDLSLRKSKLDNIRGRSSKELSDGFRRLLILRICPGSVVWRGNRILQSW